MKANSHGQISGRLHALDDFLLEQAEFLLPALDQGTTEPLWSDERVHAALVACYGERRRQILRAFGHAGLAVLILTRRVSRRRSSWEGKYLGGRAT